MLTKLQYKAFAICRLQGKYNIVSRLFPVGVGKDIAPHAMILTYF